MVKIVDTVIQALNEAGIPAVRAWPGASMPHLTGVRAAVALEKLDHSAHVARVAVTVMVPMKLGGGACENEAAQVGLVLTALGGETVQEACAFQSHGDAWQVKVLGQFRGNQVMDQWVSVSEFTVTLGTTVLPNAMGFHAEQTVDAATGVPVAGAEWTFRLEEEFPAGKGPLPAPQEPFELTVDRTGGTETFHKCRWTGVELENTASGLRQIRRGVAESRSFLILI